MNCPAANGIWSRTKSELGKLKRYVVLVQHFSTFTRIDFEQNTQAFSKEYDEAKNPRNSMRST
jgi:hypothetical protein